MVNISAIYMVNIKNNLKIKTFVIILGGFWQTYL